MQIETRAVFESEPVGCVNHACFNVLCPQKDLQVYLKNTLEIHRERTDLNDEEVCVGFYMDIIQVL